MKWLSKNITGLDLVVFTVLLSVVRAVLDSIF